MAKKRNPDKIAVEEFLEEYKTVPQPSSDPARFRMGEEKDRPSKPYDQIAADIAASTKAAEDALAEAKRQAQLATEGDERADILTKLAQAEADKKAADKAIADAKVAADAACSSRC
jgi:hypothetical protein